MPATASRFYIPALARTYEKLEPFALPLLRIAMGLILVPHGCQKLFGWFGGPGFARFAQIFEGIGYRPGMFWVTVVALTELVGGICLALGLFTRFVALAIAIFMINAIYFTSAKGFFWTQQGSEFPILIFFVALVFLIRGGGEYSLDKWIGREI